MKTFIILAESVIADACDLEDSPFNIVWQWHRALGFIAKNIQEARTARSADDRRFAREDVGHWLRDVALGAAIFLLELEEADPAAAFVAEWERAAVKHPGMTLDCDGPTDENRFYALAEEVGEVAASLTYDNAQGTGHNADTIAEVTQVGALALAWLTRYQDGGER